MVKLIKNGVYYMNGALVRENYAFMVEAKKQQAVKGTMAYSILASHNKGSENDLKLKFDALASHDITYVGIIQTAKASGLKEFPVPYTLTN
ncbi:MAG: hydratase, partial [Clostridia bacterium]|nr:hydratase [Clostridia bacterium]